MAYVSGVDKKARERGIEVFRKKFLRIAKRILEGRPPVLVIPKRTLSNTIYDERRRLLLLGPEMLRRSFLDVNEARRFMQTTLMAAIIYDALVNNEYPTIRDLYYRGKHTIIYRDEKGRKKDEPTWKEQRESDSVIRDLEVYLGLLREELLILSKEKGKVVGNMRIRSGDDVIDLSRMGHGAYAIEPTPDLIEFIDVDAEFVLVVEKDAVFQQLHRYGFWRKYKAILITSAGQPDRATRRFVRRLSEELKLPVYILTDSIPADEVVIIRDSESGKVYIGPIEELVGKYFSDKEQERVFVAMEVPSWDPLTGLIKWSRIGYIYRHKIKDKILKIKTKGRGCIRVTKAHSLFIFRDGEIMVIPAKDIRPGDYIVVADKLPPLNGSDKLPEINVLRILKEYIKGGDSPSKRFSMERTIRVHAGNAVIELKSITNTTHYNNGYILLSRSKNVIPVKIVVDEDLAWLLGIFTAEGSSYRGKYLVFNLGPHEHRKARRLARIIREKFNVEPRITDRGKKNQLCVTIGSRILYIVFKELGLTGRARSKKVPDIIINAPPRIILSYIKGLIDGDGYIDKYGDIIYSTRSRILCKQVFNLLLSLGVLPTYVSNGEDNIIRIGKSPLRTPPRIYRYLIDRENIEEYNITSEPTYGIPINNDLKRVIIKLMNRGLVSYSPKSKTISKIKLKRVADRVGKLPSDYNIVSSGDIVLVKVIGIEEEDYSGYVYDFAVPSTNSFIGSYGVVYHNSDPYGFYIYSVFKIGSITLSYESERLATSDAKFIGVMMSDVFGDDIIRKHLRKLKNIEGMSVDEISKLPRKKPYLSESERKNYIIKAKPKDIERAVELVGYDIAEACLKDREMKSKIRKKKEGLVGYPWFRKPEWIREMCIFFQTLAKLEIEAMASKGLKFLADRYIPEKIETGDWID